MNVVGRALVEGIVTHVALVVLKARVCALVFSESTLVSELVVAVLTFQGRLVVGCFVGVETRSLLKEENYYF